jgi:hypothetical protein
MKVGAHFVYENRTFGLLVPKRDGIADFPSPGNIRAKTQTQILKRHLKIAFEKYKLAADILVRYINQSLSHLICYLSVSLLELT